jgi:site-specific DNA-methyltransferase (adenine-specific)
MTENSQNLESVYPGSPLHEPTTEYTRNKAIPTFFGQPLLRGRYETLEHSDLDQAVPKLFYSQTSGEIWIGDALVWLRSIEPASVDLIFADPPYNIKKAEWDTFESQEQYVAWSLAWI